MDVSGSILLILWGVAGTLFFFEEEPTFQQRVSLIVFKLLLGLSIFILLCDSLGYSSLSVANLVFYGSLLISGLYDACEYNIPVFCSIVPLLWIFLRPDVGPYLVSWSALGSAIVVYVVFYLLARIFKFFTNKEAMGIGDAEFAAMIASFVGLDMIGPVIFIAAALGIIFSLLYHVDRVPFCTALSLATLIIILYQ